MCIGVKYRYLFYNKLLIKNVIQLSNVFIYLLNQCCNSSNITKKKICIEIKFKKKTIFKTK